MGNKEILFKLKQIETILHECMSDVDGSNQEETSGKRLKIKSTKEKIDFSLSNRAFLNKYAKGLSGPKKFTLLVAMLVKGDLKKEVKLSDVTKVWNKSKSLLEISFNRFFSVKAVENNWVMPSGHGVYYLSINWEEIFEDSK